MLCFVQSATQPVNFQLGSGGKREISHTSSLKPSYTPVHFSAFGNPWLGKLKPFGKVTQFYISFSSSKLVKNREIGVAEW